MGKIHWMHAEKGLVHANDLRGERGWPLARQINTFIECEKNGHNIPEGGLVCKNCGYMPEHEDQCSRTVERKGETRQCQNPASYVDNDGHLWCRVHTPAQQETEPTEEQPQEAKEE